MRINLNFCPCPLCIFKVLGFETFLCAAIGNGSGSHQGSGQNKLKKICVAGGSWLHGSSHPPNSPELLVRVDPSPRAVPAARWSAHLGAMLCPARAAAGLARGVHPWAWWAPALAPRCPPRCPAPGAGFQQRSLLNFPWPAFVEGCEAALVVVVYLFIFTKCSETPRVVNFGGVAVQSEKP